MHRLLLLALLALLPLACGGGSESSRASVHATVHRPARSSDPRLLEARRALEAGRLDVARELALRLGAGSGVEGALLRARTAQLAGDKVAALRELESARLTWPGDGRVPATAAEFYALEGYFTQAAEEVRRGLVVDPGCPDLERAQAVLYLSTPGEARRGLEHLERAFAADPELPYAHRPLVQALVLAARADLRDGNGEAALERATRARELEPDDPEVRETLADALAAELRFDEALALYVELLAEGRIRVESLAQLEKRAATFCQLAGDRESALTHFVRAHELGMPASELGHGLFLMREEAGVRIELGRTLLEAGELDGARAQLESALRYDPGSFAARNQLAILAFRESDFERAAAIWLTLRDGLRAAGEPLLEPVHLNLARALRNLLRRSDAAAALREYLSAEPEGEWRAETDDLLWAVERELELKGDG